MAKKFQQIPFARSENLFFRREKFENCKDEVERAFGWAYRLETSFNCDVRGNFSVNFGKVKNIQNFPKRIEEAQKRFREVLIENKSYEKVFCRYDGKETFFYCDPPYLLRGSEFKYNCEMNTLYSHVKLVSRLLKLEGMCILSGYRNRAYERLESEGWRRVDFEVFIGSPVRVKKKKKEAVDSIWICPKSQKNMGKTLFDGD